MKRTATILLWVAIVFEVLYSLLGSVIVAYNTFFNEDVYGLEPVETIYVLSRSALQIWVPAACVAVGAVVMLILMATKSKSIIPEIIALVVYSGLGSILLIPMEVVSHIVDVHTVRIELCVNLLLCADDTASCCNCIHDCI